MKICGFSICHMKEMLSMRLSAQSSGENLLKMRPHLDLSILAVTVQAEDDIAKHLGDVDGNIQGLDDAGVSIWQAVLDVVQGCVDEHAAVIPGCALHPDGLVHCIASPYVRAQNLVLQRIWQILEQFPPSKGSPS